MKTRTIDIRIVFDAELVPDMDDHELVDGLMEKESVRAAVLGIRLKHDSAAWSPTEDRPAPEIMMMLQMERPCPECGHLDEASVEAGD